MLFGSGIRSGYFWGKGGETTRISLSFSLIDGGISGGYGVGRLYYPVIVLHLQSS